MRLRGGYALLVSTGAQRATHTLACSACTLPGPIPERIAGARPTGRLEAGGWRTCARRTPSWSSPTHERSAMRWAGSSSGSTTARRRSSSATARPTRRRSWGLTGEIVDPISKGAGVWVSADADGFRIERLD